jgi:hypothetical protein
VPLKEFRLRRASTTWPRQSPQPQSHHPRPSACLGTHRHVWTPIGMSGHPSACLDANPVLGTARRTRPFTVAHHSASCALKSPGDANRRPGKNEVSRYMTQCTPLISNPAPRASSRGLESRAPPDNGPPCCIYGASEALVIKCLKLNFGYFDPVLLDVISDVYHRVQSGCAHAAGCSAEPTGAVRHDPGSTLAQRDTPPDRYWRNGTQR